MIQPGSTALPNSMLPIDGFVFARNASKKRRGQDKGQSSKTRGYKKNGDGAKAKVQVFYNLFIKRKEDEERVRALVEEQMSYFDPHIHNAILVTSIGHELPNFPHGKTRAHHEEGDEGLTLRAIWEYCKANPHHDTKVAYLHSKGSFHDTNDNKKLRPFISRGALSKECANMPEQCDVCSSRMSPIPHPHTSGNMWLARCDYIAKLVEPSQASNPRPSSDVACHGWGRFFMEHWVHSHPAVKPCDLYKGGEFTWGYWDVPASEFEPDLQLAIRRFPGGFNSGLYRIPKRGACAHGALRYVYDRIWQYDKLYNLEPNQDSWWGWEFFDVTYEDYVQYLKWWTALVIGLVSLSVLTCITLMCYRRQLRTVAAGWYRSCCRFSRPCSF